MDIRKRKLEEEKDEFMTFEQNSKEWEEFKENTLRMGASTIGTLLGQNRYQSRENYLLCYKKRVLASYEKGKRFEGNEATRFGKYSEDEGVEAFRKWFDKKGDPIEIRKIGSILSLESDLLYCSPDRLFKRGDTLYGLEVKCPFSPKNIPMSFTDVNTMHVAQCLQCLHITGLEFWYLCYFDPRPDPPTLKVYRVKRRDRLWRDIMKSAQEIFDLTVDDKEFSNKMTKEKKDFYTGFLIGLTEEVE